ncbi:hypothetical protein C8Q74DRAFT_1376023 [Fomes fomentarius]|nr:hypothetical protein C8Q74DRAFT_1376023 [Fomes fomentarius]
MKILDVPMDVFFDVTSYLMPIDILQLGRASKQLRSVLFSKSCRHVWIASRKNVHPQLPDCPHDLSEPKYAYLVFERFCMVCGSARATNVDYAVGVRLCNGCWRAKTVQGYVLAKGLDIHKDKKAPQVIYNLVPRVTRNLAQAATPLQAVEQKSRDLFYEPQFLDVVRRYLDLRDQNKKEELEQFITERKEISLQRINFHEDVMDWELMGVQDDATIEQERANEWVPIQRRLKELGYEQSDYPEHNWEWRRIMYQPRPLTARIWSINRPKMLAMLEEERKRREYARWKKRRGDLLLRYNTFLWKKGEDNVVGGMFPAYMDFEDLSCIQALLKSDKPEVTLSYGHFAAIETTLLEEAEVYRARVIADMAGAIRTASSTSPGSNASASTVKLTNAKAKEKGKQKEGSGGNSVQDSQSDIALLNAATSLFRCNLPNYTSHKICSFSMSYLGLLAHLRHEHSYTRWSANNVVHVAGSQRLTRLMESLGLDQAATTHAELNELLFSGRPTCTCGKDPMRTVHNKSDSEGYRDAEGFKPKYTCLGRLVCSLSNMTSLLLGLTGILQLSHVCDDDLSVLPSL